MFKLAGLGIAAVFTLSLLAGSCSTIGTGNVGVRSSFSQVEMEEIKPGFFFKTPMVTSIEEYNVKETPVALTNLHPKAKDNLSLKDLDVTVYYKINPLKVADVTSQFAGSTVEFNDGTKNPGFDIVRRTAAEATNDAVADMDSLTIHTQRERLTQSITSTTQALLDKTAPNTFTVTRVIIQAITTDPAIENSIKQAVQARKQLEAMATRKEIAIAQADIEITRSKGIAEANRIINGSLTREYLQHEANKALMAFATNAKGNNTVVVPANMATAPLINIK